jgi:hypothetical protein
LVSDSLRSSLDHALRERGGIQEVRRRSSGHPTHFGVRLDLRLPDGSAGHYAFEIGARPRGEFGLEEPETALHPAAAGILRDCIVEAPRTVQILVTSHSADLLDDPDLPDETIRAVEATGGRTVIAPLDEASRSVLRDRLYTAGELLRSGQLAPDRTAFLAGQELRLFGEDTE